MTRLYDKFHPAGTEKIVRRTTDPLANIVNRGFLPAGYKRQAYEQGVYIGKDTIYCPVEALRLDPTSGPTADTTIRNSTPVYSHIFASSGAAQYDHIPPIMMPVSWYPEGYMQAYYVWYSKLGVAGNVCNWQLSGYAVNLGDEIGGNYAAGQLEDEDGPDTVVGDPLIVPYGIQMSAASSRFRFINSAPMSVLFMRVRRVTNAADTLEQNAHLLGVGLRFETQSNSDD